VRIHQELANQMSITKKAMQLIMKPKNKCTKK
jgi:hypothetical protein